MEYEYIYRLYINNFYIRSLYVRWEGDVGVITYYYYMCIQYEGKGATSANINTRYAVIGTPALYLGFILI